MCNIKIEKSTEEEASFVIDELVKYNLCKVPSTQNENFIEINRVLKDSSDNIIGGINSRMYCWNCLYIDSIWIKENYRHKGYGEKLLKHIETLAKSQGVYLIHLDTFDFQAKDFYIRNGYEVFGTLDNCPEDHKRYFMKKNLITR
ncbi:GNAT family N-acetyltransferase [Clostridium fallax]|uniref:Acetyltransferase (GNAT) family protein n=1 Tax=Clostridium fallax TaxID=1533 RepID=A0A1M4XXJ2_9CLOT|nr:GNAT family N-acetyltransferase [Clostridium fallax]SHE98201.1 Acetyltransferase (GNAT) family protein [Clostridium fallax]SQB06471.1 GCN5-related N-acetyltransferase [Clostridium fallax]